MLNDSDGTLSNLEVELEALRCIYMDELKVDVDENEVCKSVALWLHPATADKVEEQYVRIFLKILLPLNYPETIPEIHISNPRGLSDEQINRIIEKLLCIAENSKGSAMLFELIEAAKEQLTAENRPCEDCAICLYGFSEEDVFTKTDCYHYFHSHCLNRYVKCKLAENTDEDDKAAGSDEAKQKIFCPVCRVPISFVPKDDEFPEPVAVVAARITLGLAHQRPPHIEKLYQKQLEQGGIIDIEAEKNRFLLEIANVPTATAEAKELKKAEPKEIGKNTEEGVKNSSLSIDQSDNDITRHKRHSPTGSPSFQHNQSRGGNRLPYRKRTDRKNDFREVKKFTYANWCQNSRPKMNADRKSNNKSQQISEDADNEPSADNNQQDDEAASDNYYRQVPDAAYNHRSKGYSHHYPGPKNSYNHQPYKSYHNNGSISNKSYGGMKNNGERAYFDGEFFDKLDGKYEKKQNAEEESPESHTDNHAPVHELPRRSNYGPRFQGRRNYQQSRYQKHEHNSVPSSSRDGAYDEGPNTNYDRKFNPRFNRPRFQDTNRPRNSESYVNYGSRGKDQMDSNSSRFQQSYSPRYQGNSYGGNARRWKDQERNRTTGPKPSFKDSSSKAVDQECESVRQNLSKAQIDNKSSVKVKSQANDSKILVDHSTPIEKCAAVVHPPPGFANPHKKVVYGLPSLNPPPGFGLS